jgi:hypothetical protein
MASIRHGGGVRGQDRVAQAAGTQHAMFGRMFHQLPTFRVEDAFLKELARKMRERASQVTPGGDNPNLPAGFTYFGQFIDHDLTFDRTSSLERMNDPDALRNFRTPKFDLDSLYGLGPNGSPALYDRDSNGTKLLVGKNPAGFEKADLPRNAQEVALIGDPRNDENIIVSQLQLTFINFHNKVVNHVANTTSFQGPDLFKEAQRITRWHYQWVVVHDFLARLLPVGMVDEILTPTQDPRVNLRFFRPIGEQPFMPVEFSVAAYRWGHSAVRPTYVINNTVPELPIFSQNEDPDPLEAFHGGRRLPKFWTISWPFFFELDDEGPQHGRKINTRLAEGLFNLPDEPDRLESLALRNLQRGKALGLPSGGRVARAMGVEQLTDDELGFSTPAPLWFYVLREAHHRGGGERLGQVGGRIVGETMLGLLAHDPLSWVSVEPGWTPADDSLGGSSVTTMAELIRFAAPKRATRF